MARRATRVARALAEDNGTPRRVTYGASPALRGLRLAGHHNALYEAAALLALPDFTAGARPCRSMHALGKRSDLLAKFRHAGTARGVLFTRLCGVPGIRLEPPPPVAPWAHFCSVIQKQLLYVEFKRGEAMNRGKRVAVSNATPRGVTVSGTVIAPIISGVPQRTEHEVACITTSTRIVGEYTQVAGED